jgi:uracil phosphoribosyltransferase
MSAQALHAGVHVCQHPLLQHNLAILRASNTAHEPFRNAIRRVSQFVLNDATQTLPLSKSFVETPVGKAESRILSPEVPIMITPILRAGLMMCDVAMDILPSASVYHVGLYRDEETLKPITYYNKLPSNVDYSQARIFILDPMLATGGSAVAAVEIISKLGVQPSNICFVSILAAPEGIENLRNHYPDVKIYTGAVDERLNDKGYIVPGLGDAGDRAFGTV